jgi:hypothetical protein
MNFPTINGYLEWRKQPVGKSSSDSSDEESQQFPQLREFVYIDQRSVRSLLASTDSGRITAEQTNRESNTSTNEHQANAGVSAGPVNVSGGKKSVSQQSAETESVYSFDLIQSKFTRLYEHEKITPDVSLNGDGTYESRDYANLSDIDRGAVLEFSGTIQLHPLYRVYRAIKYINTAAPEEGIVANGDLQVIEESLGNKIPIEVEVDGLSLDENGDIREDSEGDPFNVVALLNKAELWTEPIQTLASNNQFRLFCRVESVKSNWYPMKLIRVMESISADLAEEYNAELEGKLQAAMEAFEENVEASNQKSEVDEQTVQSFTEFLAEKASTSVNDSQIDRIVESTLEKYSPVSTVAFEQNTELLKQTYDVFIEAKSEDLFSEDASSLRSEYRQEQTQSKSGDTSERDFTAHLEVNVIGIYW